MRGDFRSLYIGWLGSVPAPPSETATKVDAEAEDDEKEEEAEDDLDVEDSDYEEEDEEDEEEDEDSIHWAERWEPPVPAGLKKLTDAQIELARFLGIGDDLLAVAAEASPDISSEDVHSVGITEWVAGLSEQEMLALLVRIVQGDGTQVQAELQSEYYQAQSASRQATRSSAGKQRRTAASLATLEAQLVEKRKRQEREANERKRNAHLATLVPRFDALWARVHELATEQKSSGYTSICGLLPDMRDAYALVGRSQEFNAKLAHFTAENSRRTALIRKLKEAKLI